MLPLRSQRPSPIGIDIGSRSVKLLQLSGDSSSVLELARGEFPAQRETNREARMQQIAKALEKAREGRHFRGRDAVLCLNSEYLAVQNLRLPPGSPDEIRKNVYTEIAGRLPYPLDEAEVRHLEAGDIRQGDLVRREIIVMAVHRPGIDRLVALAESAGLRPVAIDAEPLALLRSYGRQFRRSEDQQKRMMLVNVGASASTVVIGRPGQAMFVKYIDVGGRHFDQAAAENLQVPLADASALRRHNGERRTDQRDPEVSRTLADALRAVYERLANELSMCLRYYSVTFRGQPLARLVLGGGEADERLLEWIAPRLDIPCELSNPLRAFDSAPAANRAAQWDVAAGLALRQMA